MFFVNSRAIIERYGDDRELEIVVQTRTKPNEPLRIELPGGRIEQYESLLDALRREVKEETGLDLHEIEGEGLRVDTIGITEFEVECLKPFAAYQTIKGPVDSVGYYFRCKAAGELLQSGDESTEIQWMNVKKLKTLFDDHPAQFSNVDRAGIKFYLAHINRNDEWNSYKTRIPFIHLGMNGEVEVNYEPNQDPTKAGFDALNNLNFNLSQSIGFPTMHAKIGEYQGTGYRTSFGWIQIVTDYYQTNHEGTLKEEIYVDVDAAPYMHKLGVPFFSYGNKPEIFDAPCNNIGHHSKLKWVADTFLTTMPDRTNNETISFLLGFRWGYIEHQPSDNTPVTILPLEIITGSVWDSHLKTLREHCDWNFIESEEC